MRLCYRNGAEPHPILARRHRYALARGGTRARPVRARLAHAIDREGSTRAACGGLQLPQVDRPHAPRADAGAPGLARHASAPATAHDHAAVAIAPRAWHAL